MKIVAIDSKTSGMSPKQGDRMVEISATTIIDGVIQDEQFYTLLNPGFEIPLVVVNSHGIDNEKVQGAPCFAEIADQFLDVIRGATLLAHNAAFDLNFITWELALIGKAIDPSMKVIDTLSVARSNAPNSRNTMDALCSRFDVKPPPNTTSAHRLAALWIKMEPILPAPVSMKTVEQTCPALKNIPDYITASGEKIKQAVTITVHRGTNAIGGTCIEVATKLERFILDLGMPLMENGGGEIDPQAARHPSVENGILPDVPGLFEHGGHAQIVAVLLSHAHPDHFGLLEFVAEWIPIYMSKESKAMLEVGNIFYGPEMRVPEVTNRCRTFEHGSPFHTSANFCITPYLIDHSAFGASALLIEIGGYRIFYTGDLRAHGRKGYTFSSLPEKVGHVDCMLMEGTTFGGKHRDGFSSENEVEDGFVQGFASDGATFVLAAGGNVDRIVSLYRACKRTGKTLVIDLYQYYLLRQLQQFSSGLPPHDGDHLRLFFERGQQKRLQELGMDELLQEAKPRQIWPGDMIRNADKMVIRLSQFMQQKLANKMDHPESMRFIYSMWQGYLEKGDRGEKMANMPRAFGHEWQHIHTSGHAWLEDLQSLVKKINPDRLVPIHTLQGDSFAEHFDNVVRVEDGEVLDITSIF